MEWINVKDKLPETDCCVLMRTDAYPFDSIIGLYHPPTSNYPHGYFNEYNQDRYHHYPLDINHYIKIPDPPVDKIEI